MGDRLQAAKKHLQARPELADFDIRRVGTELHLTRGGDSFVRLIPDEGAHRWRMEYFHNLEEWQIVDFQGPLEDCLDFLLESPHYRFWEG